MTSLNLVWGSDTFFLVGIYFFSKTRIIGLVKETKQDTIGVRGDLMDSEFPSVWLEIKCDTEKDKMVCGFYREWTKEGTKS